MKREEYSTTCKEHFINLMHQFLGNTSDIDAGAAETPCRSNRSWLNKVAERDLLAEVGGLFGCSQASGASTDDLQCLRPRSE